MVSEPVEWLEGYDRGYLAARESWKAEIFRKLTEEEEDITDIFNHTEEASADVAQIPGEAPDIAQVKAMRKDQSACFFGPNVIKICQAADIVFMALHGENGENGKIQAAFDLFGIQYTGSRYLGSALAMDKGISKKMFEAAGIPTPHGIFRMCDQTFLCNLTNCHAAILPDTYHTWRQKRTETIRYQFHFPVSIYSPQRVCCSKINS